MRLSAVTARFLGGALLFASGSQRVQADLKPNPDRPPEICDLVVTADPSNGDVTILWSGGTPPFVLVRGDARSFLEAKSIEFLSMNVTDRRYKDRGASRAGRRYFYQVYDHRSPPEVMSLVPGEFHDGDVVRVRGIGFSRDCSENTVVLPGAVEVQPRGKCEFTGFEFAVPRGAVSGNVMFASPNGNCLLGDCQQCRGVLRRPATW
jgi:hypothetical protein